ncbi:hypothetical protein LCGC14_2855740, partial [marine sediment metagenome]
VYDLGLGRAAVSYVHQKHTGAARQGSVRDAGGLVIDGAVEAEELLAGHGLNFPGSFVDVGKLGRQAHLRRVGCGGSGGGEYR